MEKRTLLEDSHAILQKEEALDLEYVYYYEQMANQQQLSPNEQQALAQDVNREVRMLKDSADCLRQAHQWANEKADELNTRLHEGQKSGRKKGVFRRAPANSIIDMEEDAVNSFAAGINFYKIALIGIIGSFAGVIVEMLWCLLRHGYIESRAGLVYGPFNLVYGVGAVILTLALYRYRNRNDAISFFGGMILGSAIEYVLSWWQETFFGSTSWDYSQMPFNLNGRICLLYSIFWGVLGILWMKSLYPRMAQWILKLPNRFGKTITWILVIFMIYNSVMSLLAMDRWSERVQGQAATSVVDTFFDEHFPDARMERIYPNMSFD